MNRTQIAHTRPRAHLAAGWTAATTTLLLNVVALILVSGMARADEVEDPYEAPGPAASTPAGPSAATATIIPNPVPEETDPYAPTDPVTTGDNPNPAPGAGSSPPPPAQPAFYVHIDVDRPDRIYTEGQILSVSVRSEQDAYLYVIYRQADGSALQIFPNQFQTENRVPALTDVKIPAADDRFRWRIVAPFGKERIEVLATRQPVRHLQSPRLRAARFNPVSEKNLRGVAVELAEEHPENAYAASFVELETRPAGSAPVDEVPPSQRPAGRRFGVFFGVSQYEFNAAHLAGGSKIPLNLNAAHRDALGLREAMQRFGGLTDARTFLNEQATRANLEAALTGWLPGVTQPGDSIVIFLSGHGAQIPDDNGDEPDGLDEVFLPHDLVTLPSLVWLCREHQAGNLNTGLKPRLDRCVALLKSCPQERWGEILTRETGVSDDLLGQWLQRLSGRQVIVIADSCHAGGLATAEKHTPQPAPTSFDFLDSEVGRLKDIGQEEIALLAACHRAELALEVNGHGSFTAAILKWLAGVPRGGTLEQCHGYCSRELERTAESIPADSPQAGKPQRPLLVNHCSRPVILKP